MLIEQPAPPLPLLLSSIEAAKRIGVSDTMMRQMRFTGTGPAFCVISPNRVGYRPEDLVAWVEARPRVKSTVEANNERAALDRARKGAFAASAAA